jgi:hypothetical protein
MPVYTVVVIVVWGCDLENFVGIVEILERSTGYSNGEIEQDQVKKKRQTGCRLKHWMLWLV